VGTKGCECRTAAGPRIGEGLMGLALLGLAYFLLGRRRRL
jgi:MYXO-CTERM domain-containing protein